MSDIELRPFPPSGPSDSFDEAYIATRMRADALEDRLRLALRLLSLTPWPDPTDQWHAEYDRLLASLPESMR